MKISIIFFVATIFVLQTNAKDIVYTVEEVAKHNTSQSCWLIIEENVYDVTAYLPKHCAGNTVILKYAGKDATKAFHHHTLETQKVKDQYKIGTIRNITIGQEFTIEEVARHNTETFIWMIIDNNVFDFTTFLPKHCPGPTWFLFYAGTNITTQFYGHETSVYKMKDEYKIGTVKM